jgi:hypothetical protein
MAHYEESFAWDLGAAAEGAVGADRQAILTQVSTALAELPIISNVNAQSLTLGGEQ